MLGRSSRTRGIHKGHIATKSIFGYSEEVPQLQEMLANREASIQSDDSALILRNFYNWLSELQSENHKKKLISQFNKNGIRVL